MGTESTETAVARLDERFNGFQTILKQMASDQDRMAASYEKLVESNQRVALIEADLVASKLSITKLWEKSDALELARVMRDQKRSDEELAAQRKSIQDERRENNRWKRELVLACLPAIVAVAIYHFSGIHV